LPLTAGGSDGDGAYVRHAIASTSRIQYMSLACESAPSVGESAAGGLRTVAGSIPSRLANVAARDLERRHQTVNTPERRDRLAGIAEYLGTPATGER
jgi:hypothetical protein